MLSDNYKLIDLVDYRRHALPSRCNAGGCPSDIVENIAFDALPFGSSENNLLNQSSFFELSSSSELIAANLIQSSDAFAVLETEVPTRFSLPSFDLEFAQPGDGDWLDLLFGDEKIISILGSPFGDEKRSIVLDMADFVGLTGYLTFLLVDQGVELASVRVSNLNFVSFGAASPQPVPIPAALPLFSGALSLPGFLSWCRKRSAAAEQRELLPALF